MIALVREAYRIKDEDLKAHLEQIRIEITRQSVESIESYNFMINKLFYDKGERIKVLLPPYEEDTAYDYLMERTLNIAVDRQEAVLATRFKNEEVLPRFISRLNEMIDAGFQLDRKILQERIDFLYKIPVLVDVDDHKRIHGHWSAKTGSIHISVFEPGQGDRAKRTLYHELSHALSATSDIYGFEITVGLRRTFYDTNPVIEKLQSDFGMALNEAFTSSLQEWLLSDETPNFSRMTVAEFFKGPGDFDGTYTNERKFFVKHIGNMPIGNMTRAYFEDCTVPNIYGETNAYKDFLSTLMEYFPKGFEGLCSQYYIEQVLNKNDSVTIS